MHSHSNSELWMGATVSNMSMLSNLEEGSSWRTPAPSQNTTDIMDIKDVVATPNFSKGLLDEEWYTPEASLMELGSYAPSPYNMPGTRSSFGLLEYSCLNFDPSNNLVNSSSTCMDDLSRVSSESLFSASGGQIGQSVPVESFSAASLEAASFNPHGTSFAPYTPFPDNSSYLQAPQLPQQTLFQTPSAPHGQPATKSPPRVGATASASNYDYIFGGKAGSTGLQGLGLDADDDDDDLDESGDADGSGEPAEEEGPAQEEGGAENGSAELVGNTGHGNKAGKQRGPPAKNLMAERRRRKKLNDRLYMLRSVVPKITKMDRASILGDAIEYLNELLQRINDTHKAIEAAQLEQPQPQPPQPPSSPGGGASTQSVHLPGMKEECPLLLPNPENQPPRVEVRERDQALNVHMFCARRPGLLLSTVRALDALGLDVQQAVISCFNGFALDLFRAEAKNVDVGPEEIKAMLLLTARQSVHSLE